ncbi:MAG: BON domain-containing protein [Burkholderiaceae bacterium]|nr:BON domain-containing protein [Burkholderiaceae bacterium]
MKIRQLSQVLAAIAVALTLAACAATPKQEGTGEYFDDTVLTTKVKAVLLNDPTVSGLAVNVETFKGVVQLSGFVKSAAEREKAAQLAGTVSGVKQVRNDIVLR